MNSLPIEVDVEDSATLEEYLESLYVEEKTLYCCQQEKDKLQKRINMLGTQRVFELKTKVSTTGYLLDLFLFGCAIAYLIWLRIIDAPTWRYMALPGQIITVIVLLVTIGGGIVDILFNITMAVFDVGQHVVNNAAGVISGNTAVDASEAITRIVDALEDMELGDLFLLSMETMLISVTMHILSIIITVILYGRMIEIYLYTSIAPIPFATMTNKEWGNIGNNYLKGLFALAFQGFFMMVCVGIYAVLVNAMTISSDLHAAMFSVAAYTVILAFSLFKTGSLSKSIFNAH